MKPSFNFLGMETDYGISLTALLLMFLPTVLRLAFDLFWIRVVKKEVHHMLHTAVTAVVMIPVSVHVYFIDQTYNSLQPYLLQWGIFALFFDYGLNIGRGLDWYYIDLGTDGEQSWADGIYMRIGVLGTLGLKLWIALFTFSVYFYWSLIFS